MGDGRTVNAISTCGNVGKKIVVFCGHPCSGKTYLFNYFKDKQQGFLCLEMDNIRLKEMPGPIHDRSRRSAAYRRLHFEAAKELGAERSVALCATYLPLRARAELTALGQRMKASLFVVQFVCDKEVAAKRFVERHRGIRRHLMDYKKDAGADLTVTRVRDQAERYKRFEGALTIDTTNNPSRAQVLSAVRYYLRTDDPTDPAAWARHNYWREDTPFGHGTTEAPPKKLSEGSVRRARRLVWWYRTGIMVYWLFILIGFLPFIIKIKKKGIFKIEWHIAAAWGVLCALAIVLVLLCRSFIKHFSPSARRIRLSVRPFSLCHFVGACWPQITVILVFLLAGSFPLFFMKVKNYAMNWCDLSLIIMLLSVLGFGALVGRNPRLFFRKRKSRIIIILAFLLSVNLPLIFLKLNIRELWMADKVAWVMFWVAIAVISGTFVGSGSTFFQDYRTRLIVFCAFLSGGFASVDFGKLMSYLRRVNLPGWATFGIASGGIIGAFFAYIRATKNWREEARTIANAGRTPYYEVMDENLELPSDREIFHAYSCRIDPKHLSQMPVNEVPLFFLVFPIWNRPFKVTLIHGNEDINCTLPEEANKVGLDWNGFVKWREYNRSKEFYKAYSQEYGLRCVELPPKVRNDGEYVLPVQRCGYTEYVCKEHSVNLYSPGALPDMRRLFEGADWDKGNLDLLNKDSMAGYSMRLSVTGLLLTEDNMFVLQRRSARVATGIGSLGGTFAGAVDYYADTVRWPYFFWRGLGWVYTHVPYRFHKMMPLIWLAKLHPTKWDLEETAHRELFEETGLDCSTLEAYQSGSDPFIGFIGAAFNLRYGRDLNFYALFETKKTSIQIGKLYEGANARDRWEIERLEFLDSKQVTKNSIKNGELDKVLPGRSRHLLGALYCWAIYAGK